MRNLNPSKKATIDFHNSVVSAKYVTKVDPMYKDRVAALLEKVTMQFLEYETWFAENNFAFAKALGYEGESKNDLLALYSYKSSLIQKLRIELTTDSRNRLINTCQYCTINEINSFDHILSKDEFAEFIVNPKNLFPCCSTCNGYKNDIWREKSKTLFLNLYLDKLPNKQYLFVATNCSVLDIDLNFYLSNINNVDSSLFELIETHYNRLHLFERFKKNSDSIISELENSINAHKDSLNRSQIIKILIDKANLDKKVFGYNYWKSVLELGLINNPDFLDRLF